MQGYEALRERAAWADLSARGRLRATGDDRVRLLHAMTTNHIQQLAAGGGCPVFFLNPQGRILAAAYILAFPDALLIDTEPESRGFLYEHLDRYIIADDVTLEDVTASTVEIGIEGPQSPAVLAALGAPVPDLPYAHQEWNGASVVRSDAVGVTGFSLIAPASERAALVARIESAGVPAAGPEALRVVRLENGVPRYGEDITDRQVPHETQRLEFVHFQKGCYIGQEIVERVRARGGVHRFLVPLEIEGSDPLSGGTKIETGGKDIGEITSSAFSPARGKVVALGYVRLHDVPAGASVTAAGRSLRIGVTERRP
ncbi:MAG TPA: glycine cleavage T C-terminal barrel domain-containing protein [Bryobacteraceae bacterium]|nr:glycine cleavage T C-terminal barrel domain-containing protein [Bryobacteraceae bacterium]